MWKWALGNTPHLDIQKTLLQKQISIVGFNCTRHWTGASYQDSQLPIPGHPPASPHLQVTNPDQAGCNAFCSRIPDHV